MERFNGAATWLAGKAFELRMTNKVRLQRVHYRELRERFGLSAQLAIRCIAQVCDAYRRDRETQPTFRPDAAVPYDQRLMSFKDLDRVSLLTLEGRVIVPMVMGLRQRERLSLAKGQSDLLRRRDGKWFLLVSVHVPVPAPLLTSDFLGVDLGIVNLATDSDGQCFHGADVERVRQQRSSQRRALQQAATRRTARGERPKAIHRKFQAVAQRESRFRRNTNHVISKTLVAKATDSRCGLALEHLRGIRTRTRFRRAQRATMSGWAFAQLRAFIEYKARLAGLPVLLVEARHTSQQCSRCGHLDKANRPSQSQFHCRSCGLTLHADVNAALNIKARALVMALQGLGNGDQRVA